MKRARETEVELLPPTGAWMTPPPAARSLHCRAQALLHPVPARVALFQAESISPWKQQQQQQQQQQHKRCRDRSVPMDALSRMMSAAVTSARMKKLGMTPRFSTAAQPSPAMNARCSVCVPIAGRESMPPVATCSHCERSVGACCRRECERCSGVFCSLCSTLNCDEQFDRVFCLSCSYELSHS